MDNYQICNTHQERVEFVSRYFNSNELIGLCVRCLPLPQGVPYQQINNILINIENNKNQMINVFEQQKKLNIEIIRKLIDQVKEFKKSQEEKIEGLINQGELEINKIDKKYNNAQKQISEYNASIDIEELSKLYFVLQNDENFAETLSNLQKMLFNICQHSFMFDSYKILQEFQITMHLDLQNETNNYLKKIQKCPKHNEVIIGIDLSQQNSQLDDLICLTCIKKNQKITLTELEVVEKSWEAYDNDARCIYQNIQKMVNSLATQSTDKISEKYDKIQNKLNYFLNILSSYKISKQSEYNKMISEQKNNSIDYASINNLERLKKISKISNIEKQNIKSFQSIGIQLDSITINNSLRSIKELGQQISNVQINQMKSIKTKIQYDQIFSYKQAEYIFYSMAINSEKNILIAGGDTKVYVFGFNCGILKQLQQIDEKATCLEFMKNKNIFVSGSSDGTINIWVESKIKYWSLAQKLKGGIYPISSFVIAQRGDQIISLSKDSSLRFWMAKNQSWNNSYTTSNLTSVLDLSLNDLATKLVCCHGSYVQVFEQVKKNLWSLVQQIKTEQGYQLCFITDDSFAYHIYEQNKIQIYQYSSKQKSFIQSQCINLKLSPSHEDFKLLFPKGITPYKSFINFIKSKQILFCKSDNQIMAYKKIEQGEFLPNQFIEFINALITETVSDDGQYLITCDLVSNEIQVRQSKEYISD